MESYLSVRLKLKSFRPVVILYKSVRKITVSAFVNSAFVPEYYKNGKNVCKFSHIKYILNVLLWKLHTKAGKSPGFPLSTQTAVELSWGSYGHLAIPKPIPGTYSDLGRCVKFD